MSTVLTTDQVAVQDHQNLQDQKQQIDLLRRQLVQAQRLASLGTMATMITHEFNNILTPMLSYSQWALQQSDWQLMRKALEKVLSNGEKAAAICRCIMGFAAGESQDSTVQVARAIHDALQCLVRDPRKDNITVREQIEPDLTAAVDPIRLQQVLYNLIINARQAMLGGPGVLTLTARSEENNVKITIKDTGCGITPEQLPQIFEPFFSTKRNADQPDKQGAGLGLSITKELIEQAGGSIEAKSAPQKGTTFIIILPRAK